jgi:DNA-binding LytR/AlgR family response regulator
MSQNEQNTIIFEGVTPSLKVGLNRITNESNTVSETIEKPWTCILVDDDEIARLGLTYYINKVGVFDLVHVFSSAVDALAFLEHQSVDVLFLDIDMPELNGFDLRRQVMHIPVCVFVSAYPAYALESFDLDALDFMQKPIKSDRFVQAVTKIERYLDLHKKAEQFDLYFIGDHIVIKDKQGQIKVKLYDVLYLEAYKNYTQIVTQERQYSVLGSFSSLLENQQFSSFVRIHKSFAVNMYKVKKIASQQIVLENDQCVPIGRSYKDNLKTLLT